MTKDVIWVDVEGLTDDEANEKIKKEERKAKWKTYGKRAAIVIGSVAGMIGVGLLLTRGGSDEYTGEFSDKQWGDELPGDKVDQSKDYDMSEYLGDGGNYMLLIAETDKGMMTLEEVSESIKSGGCVEIKY